MIGDAQVVRKEKVAQADTFSPGIHACGTLNVEGYANTQSSTVAAATGRGDHEPIAGEADR
jgi:hypothetical protein